MLPASGNVGVLPPTDGAIRRPALAAAVPRTVHRHLPRVCVRTVLPADDAVALWLQVLQKEVHRDALQLDADRGPRPSRRSRGAGASGPPGSAGGAGAARPARRARTAGATGRAWPSRPEGPTRDARRAGSAWHAGQGGAEGRLRVGHLGRLGRLLCDVRARHQAPRARKTGRCRRRRFAVQGALLHVPGLPGEALSQDAPCWECKQQCLNAKRGSPPSCGERC